MKKLTAPQQLTIDVILGKKDWKLTYTKASFAVRFGNSTPRSVQRESSKRAIEQLRSAGLIETNPETNILRPTPLYYASYYCLSEAK